MSMRNPGRARTPRKDRLWTDRRVSITLPAASVGTASQDSVSFGTVFETQSARALRGVTVSTMYVSGLLQNSSGVVTPISTRVHLGVIVAPTLIDNGDFPDLSVGDGDYMLRDGRICREEAAEPFIVVPNTGDSWGGHYQLHNKSMRQIPKVGYDLFMVAQKDAATETDWIFDLTVTTLWLLPA